MIPESKRTAVALALREAFCTTKFENIRQLTSAVSTVLVFRILVGGYPYLLRIMPCVDEKDRSRPHIRMHGRRCRGRPRALRPI
jgi:hypothetical protein